MGPQMSTVLAAGRHPSRKGATEALIPLMAAIVAACVGTVVLYQLPLDVAWGALVRGATGNTTIQAIAVLYCITFLQRM